MLMGSMFEPDPDNRREISNLTGEAPSGYNLPEGCAFASRCPLVKGLCLTEDPALQQLQPEHQVACHYSKDISIERQAA